VPFDSALKIKLPEESAVAVVPPDKVTVAPLPPVPLIFPPMLHGQPDAVTVTLNVCEAVCAGVPESVTWTVNVVVPLAVGVPDITPAADKLRPAGRVVLFMSFQLTGNVPPPEASVAEYADPCVPAGRLAVVITSVAGCTVSVVLFETAPRVAVMVELPPAIPDAKPEELMVATVVFDDDQVT
jgi:hypothetical protein